MKTNKWNVGGLILLAVLASGCVKQSSLEGREVSTLDEKDVAGVDTYGESSQPIQCIDQSFNLNSEGDNYYRCELRLVGNTEIYEFRFYKDGSGLLVNPAETYEIAWYWNDDCKIVAQRYVAQDLFEVRDFEMNEIGDVTQMDHYHYIAKATDTFYCQMIEE